MDEDTLLALLLGRVPSAERGAAITHLSACPACEDLLRQRGGEIERLRASPVYRALLRGEPIPERFGDEAWSRELGTAGSDRGREAARDQVSTAGNRFRRGLVGLFQRRWYVVGMATSLAAIAIALLVTSRPAERIVLPSETDWLPSGSELTVLRGNASLPTDGSQGGAGAKDADRVTGDLLNAIGAYGRRDLGPAIQGLKSFETTGPLESIRLIYLGNALAHQGEFAEAARILRAVLREDLPDAWRDEGRWTLLVALHRTGQRASADSLRRVLAASGGEVGDRARSLPARRGAQDSQDHQ